jgi:hypothetical protein
MAVPNGTTARSLGQNAANLVKQMARLDEVCSKVSSMPWLIGELLWSLKALSDRELEPPERAFELCDV